MYFAQVDENNNVVSVIVADQEFVDMLPGKWIQTDINGVSPKNYAGIGHTWREDLNGFIPPKPWPSWKLNEAECQWEAPVPRPGDGFVWNEALAKWVQIEF